MKYAKSVAVAIILAVAVLISLRAIEAKTTGCDSAGLLYVQEKDGTITAICPTSKRPPVLIDAGNKVVATCPAPSFGGNPNA
jgi:hypothetical protein